MHRVVLCVIDIAASGVVAVGWAPTGTRKESDVLPPKLIRTLIATYSSAVELRAEHDAVNLHFESEADGGSTIQSIAAMKGVGDLQTVTGSDGGRDGHLCVAFIEGSDSCGDEYATHSVCLLVHICNTIHDIPLSDILRRLAAHLVREDGVALSRCYSHRGVPDQWYGFPAAPPPVVAATQIACSNALSITTDLLTRSGWLPLGGTVSINGDICVTDTPEAWTGLSVLLPDLCVQTASNAWGTVRLRSNGTTVMPLHMVWVASGCIRICFVVADINCDDRPTISESMPKEAFTSPAMKRRPSPISTSAIGTVPQKTGNSIQQRPNDFKELEADLLSVARNLETQGVFDFGTAAAADCVARSSRRYPQTLIEKLLFDPWV